MERIIIIFHAKTLSQTLRQKTIFSKTVKHLRQKGGVRKPTVQLLQNLADRRTEVDFQDVWSGQHWQHFEQDSEIPPERIGRQRQWGRSGHRSERNGRGPKRDNRLSIVLAVHAGEGECPESGGRHHRDIPDTG